MSAYRTERGQTLILLATWLFFAGGAASALVFYGHSVSEMKQGVERVITDGALVWQSRVELAQGKRAAAQASPQETLVHLQQNLDPSHPLIAIARSIAARSI